MLCPCGTLLNPGMTPEVLPEPLRHHTSRGAGSCLVGKLPFVLQHTLCGAFLTFAAKLRGDDREPALLLWKRKAKRAFESEL